MNSEERQCQNCKNDFIIEPEDFKFYEKIKVPAPTFCPECRMIRRMAFRDYRLLYKRKSDRTGNMIFSIVSSEAPFKVYEQDIWWSDVWDPMDYGKEIDFSKPFLEQVKNLFQEVPLASQTGWNVINSDYCSGAHDIKNCYLIFSSTFCEDCMYSVEINHTKNSLDNTRCESSELCYGSFSLIKCYKTFYSSHCDACMDVYFSRDLSGCNSCFGCTNLRNKQYYIFNKKYTQEDYEEFIKNLNLGSYNSLLKIKEKIDEIIKKSIRKFMEGRSNVNVSGDYITNSKNVFSSYYVTQAENSKYLQLFFSQNTKDCYDCTLWGENVELCYECSSVGSNVNNNKFNYRCSKNSKECEYSFNCLSSSNLFGCAELRNKQYCILNKQYTKEEYEKLVPKIKQHMIDMPYIDNNNIYKYGEFVPVNFSPFAYNESLAQEYFPLTKEKALQKGYIWRDREKRNYTIDIYNKDIPDNIQDVDDSILNKVIECAHSINSEQDHKDYSHQCTEAFKIIQQEFQFYKRMNIPIPRLCPNCRHFERVKMRNGIKFYHRQCMKEGCTNEFETSYAPERPEIIYCESCYNREIY